MNRLVLLLFVLALAGCRMGRNYEGIEGPRYAGVPLAPVMRGLNGVDTLRIVSFNIAYAIRIDSALRVLTAEPELRDADILLLQEMDEPGTRHIAEALGMNYVYYPATLHLKHRKDFGNAVLSRFPIIEDRKVILPHVARVVGTQRGATGATLQIGGKRVRVYSTHLGTVANITARQRREQLLTVLNDGALYDHIIVGGDMNDPAVGTTAREMRYAWPTEEGPRTAAVGRLDHIFVRGLELPDSAMAGTVLNQRGASDHRPIWTRVILRQR